MAQDDFIIDDTKSQGQDDPQVFNINGAEYTADQLKKYVELGKIGEEAETKYSTKLDRVWPEYTKTSQELKATKQKLSEMESMIQEQQSKTPLMPANEDQAIREAKQAARKLGLVTDEDFEAVLAKSFRKYYQQERESEKIYNDAISLESKYDGKDGRPAFVAQEMLEYMVENQISNPEVAYKIKYENEIDAWKEAQLSRAKKPGMVTEGRSTTGFKAPTDVRPTKDNLSRLVSEALNLPAE